MPAANPPPPDAPDPARAAPDSAFAARLIAWQRIHGRHDLPWQNIRDAYPIWLSEVMLQQTQVATVIPYFRRFLAAFPDVASLAQAPLERVLELWSGLGYYSRARNLHRAAQQVCERHGGVFPDDPALLEQLPGVGRSTAAAIAVFAGGRRAAILDGNVRRVLCRHDAIEGDPTSAGVLARLWDLAQARLPRRRLVAYTQGLMDLGATVCTRSRPACARCPLAETCVALARGEPTAFPRARARRPVPRREIALLLIVADDAVLLERRPDKGVWAGLWGLPECPRAPAGPRQVIARAAELPGLVEGSAGQGRIEALEAFDHALTHFRLRLSPWRITLDADSRAAPGTGAYRWLPLDALEGAALPQPVRRLLRAEARRLKAPDAAPGPAGSG